MRQIPTEALWRVPWRASHRNFAFECQEMQARVAWIAITGDAMLGVPARIRGLRLPVTLTSDGMPATPS